MNIDKGCLFKNVLMVLCVVISMITNCAVYGDDIVALVWEAPVEHVDGQSINDLAGFHVYNGNSQFFEHGHGIIYTLTEGVNPIPINNQEYVAVISSDSTWSNTWFTVTAFDFDGVESNFAIPLYIDGLSNDETIPDPPYWMMIMSNAWSGVDILNTLFKDYVWSNTEMIFVSIYVANDEQ